MKIPLGKVVPSPYQPRLQFETAELEADMKEHGMHQPILVRPVNGTYELLDGDRRVRTARKLGWKDIEADIKVVSDQEAARIVYTVNTQRADYTVEENARFFDRIRKQGANLEQMEKQFGKSRLTINSYLLILDLPKPIQKAVFLGTIGVHLVRQTLEYVGMAEGTFKDPEKAANLLQHAVDNELSQLKYAEYLKQQKVLDRIEEEREKTIKEEARRREEEAKRRLEEQKKREAELKAAEAERKRREAERAEQERLRKEAEEARRKQEEKARLLEAQRKRAEEEAKTREKEAKIYEKATPEVKQALVEGTISAAEAEEVSGLKPERQKTVIESIKRAEKDTKEVKRVAMEIAKMPEIPQITEEQVEEIRQRFQEARAEEQEILNRPEVKARGELFKNYLRLSELLSFGEPSTCPKCGKPSSNLKWTCCGLTLREAQSIAAKKVSGTYKGGEKT